MTLHEAIQQVLTERGRSMTTTEIADELNKNKLYQKKDSSLITAYQIHGRTKNYPHLFDKDHQMISLKSKTGISTSKLQIAKSIKKSLSNISIDSSLLVKVLMNEKNYKSAATIDVMVPAKPGLYCIRIKDAGLLIAPFSKVLSERGHNIIYLGIASKSLKKRFLGQELRARGHGSFFRSLGAVLGYLPPVGSLINKSNKNNYTFSAEDEVQIINWINANLLVNWIEVAEDQVSIENKLILDYQPLLNITGNPYALPELKEMRDRCRRVGCLINC